MMRFYILAAAFLAASAGLWAARAEPSQEKGPLLAELFTSQGCSSCPPAEALFAELANDKSLVTIEWHVDYWNKLQINGRSWADPYSNSAFTARQRAYNDNIRGTPSAYTPQTVLGGELEFIGHVGSVLWQARQDVSKPTVTISSAAGRASLTGKGEGEIVFVRLLKSHETRVKAGENAGRKLKGRNIALERRVLGNFSGKTATVEVPTLAENETCALFVQVKGQGRVLGATYCG
jgi:hypothetical protein